MELPEFITNAQEAMTARRVFNEPIEKDGLTIITVAKVSGGGGGGSGGDPEKGQGAGGGFGLGASPVGAYVIKDGKVSWEPALDLNRVIFGGQLVAIVLLLTIGSIVRRWMRGRMAEHVVSGRRFGPPRRA